MRSVTLYFNSTLYRKNLSRFWPLWVSWMVLWLFLLPLNLVNLWRDYGAGGEQEGLYRFLRNCLDLNSDLIGEGGVVFGMIYAMLIVMAVYGYLFNHRSAATMHALPMRRENLFLTNFLSGATFFLLPNAVVFALAGLVELVTLPAELSAITLPALWSGFWVMTGCTFFFYCFAVFCAQFTGNVLALPAFYLILNFLVYVMYSLVCTIGREIFYGGWPILGEPAWVRLLTPAYALITASQWYGISWRELWDYERNVPILDMEKLELGFQDPCMIAGYAVAGVALAGLALLVYRRRHIETAGDVVSVKLVRPIFRAGVSVCAGLCGGIVTAAFFGWMDVETMMGIAIVVWSVVGFFAAEMLLNKSFRVFKKSWKSGLVTALVMALAVGACFLDVFGVETWVPGAGEVEEVQIQINNTFPLDDGAYLHLDVNDPAQVEKIVNLHQSIIDDYERYGEAAFGDHLMSVYLNYRINGQIYRKSYNYITLLQDEIGAPGTTTYLVDQFVNDPDMIDYVYQMDTARKSRIVCTELDGVVYPGGRLDSETLLDGAEEIWEAVQADFAAGNLGHRYLFDDDVRDAETYRTDLKLRFLLPEEEKLEGYDLYYERYVGEASTQEVPAEESEYSWNFTVTVTLTPKAERTIAALEKYSNLGQEYGIALHSGESVNLK